MKPLKRPRFVSVVGNSMFPTYKENNVLFCVPVPFRHIKEGDVIIFIPPDEDVESKRNTVLATIHRS